jgi:hypothetical protein
MKMLPCLGAVAALGTALAFAQPAPTGSEFHVNTYTTSFQTRPVVVGTDVAGDFVVVWQSTGQDGSDLGVFARRFRGDGTPRDAQEFQVNTYTTGKQYRVSAASDGEGGFVVAWESNGQDGSSGGAFARRFSSAGVPLDAQEFRVNTYTTGPQSYPAVAVRPGGDFMVVWQDSLLEGSGKGIFGRRYDRSGAPLDGQEFPINTYTTGNQDHPAVAVDASGDFVVVWVSNGQDGSGLGVFGRRFDSSGAPLDAEEFQVNTYTTSSQYRPAIAAGGSGDFVVSWNSYLQDGSILGVFARRFDAMAAPLDAQDFQVNVQTVSHQRNPSVAADRSGDFVVTWEDVFHDGFYSGVFARRFDSTGVSPDPQDFLVNTFTTNSQYNATVASTGTGAFVVAWNSVGEEPGGTSGIFAQVYGCGDADADGLCDYDDVVLTSPLDGATLDGSNPKLVKPLFAWSPGHYDLFQVLLATDPAFTKGTFIKSGNPTAATAWTPPTKKWKSACARARSANPGNPTLYVKVVGRDRSFAKSDPNGVNESQVLELPIRP